MIRSVANPDVFVQALAVLRARRRELDALDDQVSDCIERLEKHLVDAGLCIELSLEIDGGSAIGWCKIGGAWRLITRRTDGDEDIRPLRDRDRQTRADLLPSVCLLIAFGATQLQARLEQRKEILHEAAKLLAALDKEKT